MAGGFTYHELMLANANMRAQATAASNDNYLRQLYAIEQDWHRKKDPAYIAEEMARIRYEERVAAERAAIAAQRVREEQQAALTRAATAPPARPPEREAVCCAPSRYNDEFVPSRNVVPEPVHRWQTIRIFSGKVELRDAIERKTFMGTAVQQVAYEWGYIKAMRDMGQTAEADRLERKMRRGSIFRVEKGKAAAEVKELETLYEREG